MLRERLLTIIFVAVLLFSGVNLVINNTSGETPLGGSTLYVGPTSTYKSIQSAIENASSGDIIIVANGTYNESVLINKANINLTGNSTTNCTIRHHYDGNNMISDYAAAINVTAAGVNITGFNITVSGRYTIGIYLKGFPATNTKIYNNNITTSGNNGYGIFIYQSSNNNVTKNNITTTGYYAHGVYLYLNSANNDLINNTINTTGGNSHGISLAWSDDKPTLWSSWVTRCWRSLPRAKPCTVRASPTMLPMVMRGLSEPKGS